MILKELSLIRVFDLRGTINRNFCDFNRSLLLFSYDNLFSSMDPVDIFCLKALRSVRGGVKEMFHWK